MVQQTFPKTFVNNGNIPIIILFLANNNPDEKFDFTLHPGTSVAKDWSKRRGHPITKIDLNWMLTKDSCRTITIDLSKDADENDYHTYNLYDDFKIIKNEAEGHKKLA